MIHSFPFDECPSPVRQEQPSEGALHSLLLRQTDPLEVAALTTQPPLHSPERGENGGEPKRTTLRHLLTTPLGRIGIFALPLQLPPHEARSDAFQQEVLQQTSDAIALAQACGAQVIALCQWLPQMTNHGLLVQQSLPLRAGQRPRLTTGEASSLAALFLHLEQVLPMLRRDLRQERLALVGTTDALAAMLHALLTVLAHPPTIIVRPLPSSAPPDIEASLMLLSTLTRHGFEGEVMWASDMGEVMAHTTLLLDLTADGLVLDSESMQSGVVALSRIPIRWRNDEHFHQRLATREDVLLIEGGHLTSHDPLNELWLMPDPPAREDMHPLVRRASGWHTRAGRIAPLLSVDAQVLSGAIVQRGGPAVLGPLDESAVLFHVLALQAGGMQATPPHHGPHTWTDAFLHAFRARFGYRSRRSS
ncbi:hypothetical protein [Ktedonospora formicarum]|uniref:Uncharacterized protein n=1 Tax=Ktedonospora formicarum TaxID=2778364 RepID=A0A8J3MXJ9_9CHLR|nr:hypothetical protein [Ktedonospora formicarum]GHO48650.1 hypothetical protein KSX_68130 [Ktedonospora formicarum]